MNSHIIKTLSAVTALTIFAGFVWGAQVYLQSNYATAADFRQLENRLDVKILQDQLFNVQERIWRIEDRYENKDMSIDAKEQHRTLLEEKTQIEKDLDSLKQSE